jgi:O-antigen/teichoic acid export membrane protein
MIFLKSITKILKTKTITHSAVTLLGTTINGLLGVLFFIYLARILGPENFGIFSISIVVLTLVSDIADFGINTGLINFVSRHILINPTESLRFLKLGLTLKLISSLIVLILGFILAPFIAKYIFLKPELTYYLILSFVGVGGAMLFSFSTNSLQALQKYTSWSILNIFANALRLLTILLLASGLLLSTENALITYIFFPFFGFFISLFLLPKKFLTVKNERSVLKEFFHYNKWVALSILVAAVSSRLDSFFVTRFLSIEQTGYYSVGVQLSSILPQFTFAIAAVVAPKIASHTDKKELLKYLKKLQLLVLGIAVLGFLLSPINLWLLPRIYGSNYTASILPFLLLLYAQLIFFISLPSHQTIFYYFAKPKIFVLISIIILLTMVALNILLIPSFGILGAAISVLIGSIINLVLPGIYVYRKLKSK